MFNGFYKLRIKRQRLLNHLRFLLTCKRSNFVPDFIKIKCNLQSTRRISNAINRCHFAVLRAVIQDVRSKLASLKFKLYKLHLHLAAVHDNVQPDEHSSHEFDLPSYTFHERRSWERSSRISSLHRRNQDKKLESLRRSRRTSFSLSKNLDSVVNLSKTQLTSTQMQVLDLGYNFAVSRKPSITKTVAPIESAISRSKISTAQKETLRLLVMNAVESNNFRNAPNLNRDERVALQELKSNEQIVITKADKGGKTVILDKEHYENSMKKLVNEGPYLPLQKNPVNAQLKEIKTALRNIPCLSQVKKKFLIPTSVTSAKLYGLPKIHKPGDKFRPITSKIGTPSYNLSKFLVSIFSPLLSENSFTVKNSVEFVRKLQEIPFQNYLMVSFDVESLFTNVPINEALACLRCRLQEFHFSSFEIDMLISLTKLCLSQNTFIFRGTSYQQQSGLAMGDPLSPILSDIFLHYFEKELLQRVNFHFYARYVDDTFILCSYQPSELPDVLKVMNSINPNIQFTYECEINSELSFLDVFIRKTDDKFSTSVYRKSCAVTRPPHNLSCHPFNQKMSAFYTFVYRAIHICSDNQLLTNELNTLKHIAARRGYNRNIIDSIFQKLSGTSKTSHLQPFTKPIPVDKVIIPFYNIVSLKICKILKKFGFSTIFVPQNKISPSAVKDPVGPHEMWGIYRISCQCDLMYIGQTRRSLQYRLTEHQRYVKNQEISKSAIARHCWDNSHHFKFQEAKVIHRPTSVSHLNFCEAFLIHSHSEILVNDISSTPPLSDVWKYLIENNANSRSSDSPH